MTDHFAAHCWNDGWRPATRGISAKFRHVATGRGDGDQAVNDKLRQKAWDEYHLHCRTAPQQKNPITAAFEIYEQEIQRFGKDR